MTTTLRPFIRPILLGVLGCLVFLTTSALFGVKAPAPDFAQAQTVTTVTIPTWAAVADQYPACWDAQEGADKFDPYAPAIVADADTGKVQVMPVQDAWDRASDKRAGNDVWTLGLCR